MNWNWANHFQLIFFSICKFWVNSNTIIFCKWEKILYANHWKLTINIFIFNKMSVTDSKMKSMNKFLLNRRQCNLILKTIQYYLKHKNQNGDANIWFNPVITLIWLHEIIKWITNTFCYWIVIVIHINIEEKNWLKWCDWYFNIYVREYPQKKSRHCFVFHLNSTYFVNDIKFNLWYSSTVFFNKNCFNIMDDVIRRFI